VYGDLFQLVEYVQSGGQAPSRGGEQGGSAGHREALVWLCGQFGIPFDDSRVTGDAGLDVVHLFAMAAHEHLLQSPELLDWIQEKWGFDRSTVEAYGLGYMPSPLLPSIATEAKRPQSRGAFRSSGLGWYTDAGTWRTRFEGRVLFPYLEHGRAVYLIGRATPWTPKLDHGAPPPKYHKLSVHSERRPYVSERVTNDHLYNEPIMATADEIGVVEGVADAVAISSLGVPVVSPVTISFNAVDLERFLSKCHDNGIGRVWILFDNELSGSGNFAARRVALKLVEGGLSARILTLPLGPEQEAARDEVMRTLGAETFDELERSDPNARKRLITERITDENARAWLVEQINASKIDAAEWAAQVGAGAPGKFDGIRRAGRDVLDLEIEDVAARLDMDASAIERADAFAEVVDLAAHVEARMLREDYAGRIAKAAGKGVTKGEVAQRIARARREVVKPKRQEEKEKAAPPRESIEKELVLPPPRSTHTQPAAPPPPAADPNAPAAPPPPGQKTTSEHEHFAATRAAVAKGVEAKWPDESLGDFIAQAITRSMGYTPFRTPEELYLVRGNRRVPVGLATPTPQFADLLWLASGLTSKKASHRAYIAAVVYFLGRDARPAQDVSWSFVDEDGAVFFPLGDEAGRLLRISPGSVKQTRMAEARVPAVAGMEFRPVEYVEAEGGIDRALEVFRWTSVSPGDRLVLVYWLACLPVLRRIGTVPIVRIEGGSSSGKTRAVDALSLLVNGKKSSSVPTAAALVSRMSTEMLTVDDNRESGDVTPAFLGTLLQATHLGAREKRKVNTDTGTVVERVCGALLMNGIEPIHDGRSELASRILTLRCSEQHRATDSPRAEAALAGAILGVRDAFWSDAVRRCAAALELDRVHGEGLGALLEELFGSTKIGRLSSYVRIMYQAWVAGQPADRREELLGEIAEPWRSALSAIASGALESLLAEELSVSVLRYVFDHGQAMAEAEHAGSDKLTAFGGRFSFDRRVGDASLGPIRATQLARLARAAGKDYNAPRAVSTDLRAGQLERRLLDGLAFLEAAGYHVEVETTRRGRNRFTFYREGLPTSAPPDPLGGDSWLAP